MNNENSDIDSIYNDFVVILHNATKIAVPNCKFNPHTKPYWSEDVKLAHIKEKSLRNIWVAEGRPRGMNFVSYRNYKRAKAEFRHSQQAANDAYTQKCFSDLNDAAKCDLRLFWRLIKRFSNKDHKDCPEIIYKDCVYSDPESVTECLRTITETYIPKRKMTLLIER